MPDKTLLDVVKFNVGLLVLSREGWYTFPPPVPIGFLTVSALENVTFSTSLSLYFILPPNNTASFIDNVLKVSIGASSTTISDISTSISFPAPVYNIEEGLSKKSLLAVVINAVNAGVFKPPMFFITANFMLSYKNELSGFLSIDNSIALLVCSPGTPPYISSLFSVLKLGGYIGIDPVNKLQVDSFFVTVLKY